MRRKIEGKMKEDEENRGINDKRAYDDQFTAFSGSTFCQFQLGALFYSLIFSYLAHLEILEHSWSMLGALQFHWDWIKKAKEGRKAKGNNVINNYSRISLQVTCYMYDLLVDLLMYGTCM